MGGFGGVACKVVFMSNLTSVEVEVEVRLSCVLTVDQYFLFFTISLKSKSSPPPSSYLLPYQKVTVNCPPNPAVTISASEGLSPG